MVNVFAMVSLVTNCLFIRRIVIFIFLRISGLSFLSIMRFSERERLVSLWVEISLLVNSSF